ncbi:MAG TPA: hypothetical protein VJV78_49005 [Polyangiales bacterium]|nr:hypothetical protein [Polyangiales bacterium]
MAFGAYADALDCTAVYAQRFGHDRPQARTDAAHADDGARPLRIELDLLDQPCVLPGIERVMRVACRRAEAQAFGQVEPTQAALDIA